jgi:hypothetical protein
VPVVGGCSVEGEGCGLANRVSVITPVVTEVVVEVCAEEFRAQKNRRRQSAVMFFIKQK